MTQAQGQTGVARAAAFLPRLLVVLAFVLFGLPHTPPEGPGAQPVPAAQNPGEQAHAILPVQRHLLRTPLPGDTSPDMALPGGTVQPRPPLQVARVQPAPQPRLRPANHSVLPPARGPPAV